MLPKEQISRHLLKSLSQTGLRLETSQKKESHGVLPETSRLSRTGQERSRDSFPEQIRRRSRFLSWTLQRKSSRPSSVLPRSQCPVNISPLTLRHLRHQVQRHSSLS